jgi:hypothetical protein
MAKEVSKNFASGNLKDLSAAKAVWSQRLFQAPRAEGARGPVTAARALRAAVNPEPEQNVVGVGVGEKISNGQHTGVMAVKFLVRLKYPEGQISEGHVLPKSIDGLPVDVEEVGTFRAFAAAPHPALKMPNPRTKIRPAHPGCSVGFQDPNNQFTMAGTFGALVKDQHGKTYILSNNHVLADENQLPRGAAIFQPGLLDHGNAATDQIAKLTKFVPLDPNAPNKVDCAIAELVNPGLADPNILFIGQPSAPAQAQIDMTVQKFGRTTSYSVGRISSIDTDVKVGYETGTYAFSGQIIVVGLNGSSFSAAGDSGSLIVERPGKQAVGLLFGGSSSHTIANHIGDVLAALKVTLA